MSGLISVNTLRSFLLLVMAGSFAFIHTGDQTMYMPLLMWLFFYLLMPGAVNLITLPVIACWGYLLAAAFFPRLRQNELTTSVIIILVIPIGFVFLQATPSISFSHTSMLFWLPCLVFTLAGYFYMLIRKR